MRKTMLGLINEFTTTVLRRSFLFTLFGIPIIAGIVFSVVGMLNKDKPGQVESFFSPAVDVVPAGFIDNSGLITQTDINPQLIAYTDERIMREDLAQGKISGFYIIPANYMESGDLTYVKQDFNPLTAFDQSRDFQKLIDSNLLGGDPVIAEHYINPLNVEMVNKNPKPEQAQESTLSIVLPTVVSIMFYIVLISAASLLLQSITKEKENRILEILMSSATTGQILTGKIIALGLVGLLQTGVWLGSGFILMGAGQQSKMIPMDGTIPYSILAWALVFFLGGYLLYASLMAGIGALVPNLREASQATTMVIIPIMVPLIMMNNLIQDPNGTVAMALSFIPFTSPVAMLTRMAVTDIPIWQGIVSVLVLFLFAVWVIRVVSKLFRGQVMLGGQPFSRMKFLRALTGIGD
jgi:ABC-2 type transport system permease protein